MKIKRSSWHYRYIASKWTSKPQALCWYFWKIVLSVLWRGVQGLFGIALGIGVLILLTVPIWGWFASGFIGDVSIVSFIMWTVIGGKISYEYRKHLYKELQLIRMVRPTRERTLLEEYLHARHRKVCPLLEYKDD